MEARDASSWVEGKLGNVDDLSSTEKQDLQMMLDFFPPYLDSLIHTKVCQYWEDMSSSKNI